MDGPGTFARSPERAEYEFEFRPLIPMLRSKSFQRNFSWKEFAFNPCLSGSIIDRTDHGKVKFLVISCGFIKLSRLNLFRTWKGDNQEILGLSASCWNMPDEKGQALRENNKDMMSPAVHLDPRETQVYTFLNSDGEKKTTSLTPLWIFLYHFSASTLNGVQS